MQDIDRMIVLCSTLTLRCKHYGEYENKRRIYNPKIRPQQVSSKMGCPVNIRLEMCRKRNCLYVKSLSEISEHNHIMGSEVASFHVKNRKLHASEIQKTQELLEYGVSSRKIANNINKIWRTDGVNGTVLPKDIRNKLTTMRLCQRGNRSEEELLSDLCNLKKLNDPGK